MRYRVNTHGSVAAPCYCQPLISFDQPNNLGTVSVTVGLKNNNTLIFPGTRKTPLVVSLVSGLIALRRADPVV